MKYILTTVFYDEPMFISAVPTNAKQEVCSKNWKGEKSKRWVNVTYGENKILAFPTEEMRDAFYENFKDLIEQCKELL